jgi:U3 small nucleolar RNA-associated protein 3
MPKKQSVSASSSEAEMAEDEQSEISIPDDIIAQDTDSLQTLLSDLRDSLAIAAEKLQPL